MTRATYAPKETYVGNGALDTYTFDFKIEAKAQLLVIEVDDSGVETERVLGTDVTYLSSVTFDAVAGGGSVVLAANLTTDYSLILLLANDDPTQPYEFANKTSFTLKRFESALDFIAGAVQRLAYRGKQAFRIHDLDDEDTFDAQLPAGVATALNKTLVVNAAGDGMEYGPTTNEISNAQGYAEAAAVSAAAAAQDAIDTAADLVATNQDTIDTAADVVSTNADVVSTNADAASTAQDALDTAADVLLTNADAASTAQDAIDTAADLVATNQDTIDTAADVVSTNADATSTAQDASDASDSADEAAASAASINLPTLESGDAGGILQVNDAEDGYDVIKNAERLDTEHLHVAADFLNVTNLYGWHINGSADYDDGDWNGSKALTENGALSTLADVLGNTTYCNFDGSNDWLSSTDAVFDAMTGSFSGCCWAYKADWDSAVDTDALICKSDTVNGWLFYLNNAGYLTFYNYTAAAEEARTVDTKGLEPGWHHFAFVREDGTGTALYVDGKCHAYTNLHGNITDAGNLEIGSYNGGTNLFTGGIQEVVVDTDTAWTPNQVRKIYSASCQKLAVQETVNLLGEAKVSIHDGRRINGRAQVNAMAIYNVTNAWADVTGLKQYAWEDGWYQGRCEATARVHDADGPSAICQVRLSKDGVNAIDRTEKILLFTADNNTFNIYAPFNLSREVYLSKGDPVTLQALMNTGDNCEIDYSAGVDIPYIQLIKLN